MDVSATLVPFAATYATLSKFTLCRARSYVYPIGCTFYSADRGLFIYHFNLTERKPFFLDANPYFILPITSLPYVHGTHTIKAQTTKRDYFRRQTGGAEVPLRASRFPSDDATNIKEIKSDATPLGHAVRPART